MLLLPNSRIWKYQLILMIALGISISAILVISYAPFAIKENSRENDPRYGEELYSDQDNELMAKNTPSDFLLLAISLLVFLIGLLIISQSLFFWVPSLTDLASNGKNGKMVWEWKRAIFPERVYSLKDQNANIIVRRLRYSFNGLFMKEFRLEIYIPIDNREIKRISDFIGIEKTKRTDSQNILMKTVRLKYLPLDIIKIRTILESMMKKPIKLDPFTEKPL